MLSMLASATAAYQIGLPYSAFRSLRASLPRMADDEFAGVTPKTVFMFPGQGAQAVGMGREVAAEVPAAAELYAKASEILGYSLLDIDDKAKLDTTAVSQPAIFVASMAAVEKLRASEGGAETIDSANMAMGLSLGEYTALAFAGAISFEDGVRITKARGEAMQVQLVFSVTIACSTCVFVCVCMPADRREHRLMRSVARPCVYGTLRRHANKHALACACTSFSWSLVSIEASFPCSRRLLRLRRREWCLLSALTRPR